jgi:hypothetical protein
MMMMMMMMMILSTYPNKTKGFSKKYRNIYNNSNIIQHTHRCKQQQKSWPVKINLLQSTGYVLHQHG